MKADLLYNDKVLSTKIKEFIVNDIDEEPFKFSSDPFWGNLIKTGTELWLDSGDIDDVKETWSAEMTALTTNNTLLNKEIQKGIYDDYIRKAAEMVGHLEIKDQVMAIAFILNARHGLRLSKMFNAFVSVELHTDISHDFDAIVEFGKYYHEINPRQFIIKVPFTPTGLLGARRLRELNVKVNLTLEFSTRQNVLVAAISKPNFCNVFLGRLGAYLKDNNLGDGTGIGEKAVLNSQKLVKELTWKNKEKTKLIAASLRSADQLEKLAGVDVFTIPVKVAVEGKTTLNGNFTSMLDTDYPVNLNNPEDEEYVKKLWEVTPDELSLARHLGADLPQNEKELIERVYEVDCGDMFPRFSDGDYKMLAEDGKIPVHNKWVDRIKKGEMSLDALLNMAGLASFAKDQAQLDERIRKLII